MKKTQIILFAAIAALVPSFLLGQTAAERAQELAQTYLDSQVPQEDTSLWVIDNRGDIPWGAASGAIIRAIISSLPEGDFDSLAPYGRQDFRDRMLLPQAIREWVGSNNPQGLVDAWPEISPWLEADPRSISAIANDQKRVPYASLVPLFEVEPRFLFSGVFSPTEGLTPELARSLSLIYRRVAGWSSWDSQDVIKKTGIVLISTDQDELGQQLIAWATTGEGTDPLAGEALAPEHEALLAQVTYDDIRYKFLRGEQADVIAEQIDQMKLADLSGVAAKKKNAATIIARALWSYHGTLVIPNAWLEAVSEETWRDFDFGPLAE